MTIRGKVTVALLSCAALALLSACSSSAPKPLTSEQIKASASAELARSLQPGRATRQAIIDAGGTPSDEECQAMWDRKTAEEQHSLLYAEWMHGCADAPG